MAATSAPSASSATTPSSGKEVLGQPRPSPTTAHLPATCDGFDAAFPHSATHESSTNKELDAFSWGSACVVPTALTLQSNAVAYNTGTDGPKPDTTRLRSRKRYRALALPEHRGAEKDPQLLKAVEDAAPMLWGCDVQTTGVNGLSDDAFRQRRKLRYRLRRGGLYNIVGGKGKRPALAERSNPPAATPVTTAPGGWPHITLNHIFPASFDSAFCDENGASVPGPSITLSNGKALDTVQYPSDPSLEESPRPASHRRGENQFDAEFLEDMVEKAQSGLSQSPQDDTSLAMGPQEPKDISRSPARAAPPAFGALAAVKLLKSGNGTLFRVAAPSASEARDPLDLASAVPVPEKVPRAVESLAEGPVAESELTQEEQDRSINDWSMGLFLDTHVVDLQAQTGEQWAEQQPQQSEQLQEGIWASQPAEHGQQQQAPESLFAQLPQQAWDSQPLPLTGQQGQGQGQQLPFFPATVAPQQPAHGPSYTMPQQSPPWFSPFLTAAENALNAPFPPQPSDHGNGYTPTFFSWTDPICQWNIWIYCINPTNGQQLWRSVCTGEYRAAEQAPPQAPRGPRGGQLRVPGRARASASAPVGSAPVSLGPAVANAQGNGLFAAGEGVPAPVMMQEQPSEQTLVDPALLGTCNQPGEQVFQPMMSGALEGSPHLE
ncbi:MAG: hypothetical protein OHK93_005420 [Ramalina farinacea]|uniref:Uncharacterized protein n=1 Tax=Ramalina farinacea TaxID=258253 RepID=A0AA43TSM4_9LECA|nr:hypothetical protein [Ramalina farinacea]